jgi:ABC-type amino acid transport substrate-binding protein
VDDYAAAFRAVQDGRADAAVVNRLFGLEQEANWNLQRSAVAFNPIALKFAFTTDSPRTPELIGSSTRGSGP